MTQRRKTGPITESQNGALQESKEWSEKKVKTSGIYLVHCFQIRANKPTKKAEAQEFW